MTLSVVLTSVSLSAEVRKFYLCEQRYGSGGGEGGKGGERITIGRE